MKEPVELSLLNIVLAIAEAVELVDTRLADHHARVAYITGCLAETLGLTSAEQQTLTIAGAMHDIGVLSLDECRGLFDFESETRLDHGEIGYLFLKPFPHLSAVGELIRDHHVRWENGAGEISYGHAVPLYSHLIHLADRVALLIDPREEVLTQAAAIRERIMEQAGRMFVPRFVEAFLEVAEREYFWLGAAEPSVEWYAAHVDWERLALDGAQFTGLARLFCHIVDFKARSRPRIPAEWRPVPGNWANWQGSPKQNARGWSRPGICMISAN